MASDLEQSLMTNFFARGHVFFPKWMSICLWAAAIYNVIWGAVICLFPTETLQFLGLKPMDHIQIWQCLGMVVGVYGVGYACAAKNPIRHWPIVFVGLLGKVLGPIGFVVSALQETLPWRFGLLNITNDIIWIIPFFLILKFVYEAEPRNYF